MIFLVRLLGACVRNVHCKHQSKQPQSEDKTAAQDQASEHKKHVVQRNVYALGVEPSEVNQKLLYSSKQRCHLRCGLETLKLEANFALEERQGTSNVSAVMCTLTSSGEKHIYWSDAAQTRQKT